MLLKQLEDVQKGLPELGPTSTLRKPKGKVNHLKSQLSSALYPK